MTPITTTINLSAERSWSSKSNIIDYTKTDRYNGWVNAEKGTRKGRVSWRRKLEGRNKVQRPNNKQKTKKLHVKQQRLTNNKQNRIHYFFPESRSGKEDNISPEDQTRKKGKQL